jgi:hypothetical protein
MGAKNRRQVREGTSAPPAAPPPAAPPTSTMPVSPAERRLLAKSRVYMLLFALGGFLFAACCFAYALYGIYEVSRQDDAIPHDYGFEERLAVIGGFTILRSLIYSVAFGSISLTLWKWAIAKRAARDGQISREQLAARQLSFWRVVGIALALFLIVASLFMAYLAYGVYQRLNSTDVPEWPTSPERQAVEEYDDPRIEE